MPSTGNIWEVNFIISPPAHVAQENMVFMGNRWEAPMPGEMKQHVQTYSVAADGRVEDTLFTLLLEVRRHLHQGSVLVSFGGLHVCFKGKNYRQPERPSKQRRFFCSGLYCDSLPCL